MNTVFIEVTNSFNWGKFAVCRFDAEEWERRSGLSEVVRSTTEEVLNQEYDRDAGSAPLLRQVGWGPDHIFVLDLQTGEGGIFRPGGYAAADLDKHKIWVCPMFQPFLTWLYKQDLSDLDALPSMVQLTEDEAASAMFGYRREGPLKERLAEFFQEHRLGDPWTVEEYAFLVEIVMSNGSLDDAKATIREAYARINDAGG